ncbi:hypothetical protein D7147_18515 [Micromonospora musae]|uniref:Uncharacterized protein n=1 Tax=Micromonospora musae TaxID=1894970 RepID=A0A3A9YJA5_9ACTN|nr:hypothetical protein D7147_18515 [Micromonospora musae]RKN32937.1 hypothetical protein D7044_11960 [Micromonospora musae]
MLTGRRRAGPPRGQELGRLPWLAPLFLRAFFLRAFFAMVTSFDGRIRFDDLGAGAPTGRPAPGPTR